MHTVQAQSVRSSFICWSAHDDSTSGSRQHCPVVGGLAWPGAPYNTRTRTPVLAGGSFSSAAALISGPSWRAAGAPLALGLLYCTSTVSPTRTVRGLALLVSKSRTPIIYHHIPFQKKSSKSAANHFLWKGIWRGTCMRRMWNVIGTMSTILFPPP